MCWSKQNRIHTLERLKLKATDLKTLMALQLSVNPDSRPPNDYSDSVNTLLYVTAVPVHIPQWLPNFFPVISRPDVIESWQFMTYIWVYPSLRFHVMSSCLEATHLVKASSNCFWVAMIWLICCRSLPQANSMSLHFSRVSWKFISFSNATRKHEKYWKVNMRQPSNAFVMSSSNCSNETTGTFSVSFERGSDGCTKALESPSKSLASHHPWNFTPPMMTRALTKRTLRLRRTIRTMMGWFSIGFHDLARPLQKPSLDRMFVETSKAGLVPRNTKNQKAFISSFNMF